MALATRGSWKLAKDKVKDKLVRTDLTILPLNRGWAGCAGGGERTLVGAAAGSAGRAGRES